MTKTYKKNGYKITEYLNEKTGEYMISAESIGPVKIVFGDSTTGEVRTWTVGG